MKPATISIILLSLALIFAVYFIANTLVSDYIDNVNQTSYMQGIRDARLMILQEIYTDLSDDSRMTILFPVNATASLPVTVEVIK